MIADILSAMIKRADAIKEEISDLEEILAQRKADMYRILDEDIPAVLHENGLDSASLLDGRTVEIRQEITATQLDKEALRAWLSANQYDSIIRTDFSFGKGTNLDEVEKFLAIAGIDYSRALEIHPMSLKKVIREHLEAGGPYPPEEAVKVTIFERAKIKGGKE